MIERLAAVNYFPKEAPSQMVDWVVNTPLYLRPIQTSRMHKYVASGVQFCHKQNKEKLQHGDLMWN